MIMRRLFPILPVLALMMALLAPSPARAGSITGGVLNASGERSHNVAGAWPEFFYVWEGYVRHNLALGPWVSIQLYPFAWSVGAHVRMKLLERGKFSMALAIVPTFNVAGFGGSRASYRSYVGGAQVGRASTFRPSMGPGVNVALRASIDVAPQWRVNVTYENPLALWIWVDPASWWIEWPMTFTGGAEYEINHKTSVFGRVGAGPAIAFTGSSQLLGAHWNLHIGAQFRY
jgi:hypothetical protein